jgi:hypothetical protein
MRDHERLAIQRTRLRISSIEHTSARSSGATLIQELSPPLKKPSVESPPIEDLAPAPVISDNARNNSIQETPKRHIRSESTPNRLGLMSNEVPPPELRGFRRRSLGLKDLMKKMVKKDAKADAVTEGSMPTKDEEAPDSLPVRAALSIKDKNALVRPTTAAPKMASQDPFYTPPTAPMPQNIRPANVRRHTPRYYATADATVEIRPQTAAGEVKASKDDTTISTKRRSWGAS